MSSADQAAYAKGVAAVLAIASATAAQLESSTLPTLRRELAIETLNAIAEEGRALLPVAARKSGQEPH